MADFDAFFHGTFNAGTFAQNSFSTQFTLSDAEMDSEFTTDDTVATVPPTGFGGDFLGTFVEDGATYLVFDNGGGFSDVFSTTDPEDKTLDNGFTLPTLTTTAFTVCFGAGTAIATPTGEKRVEDLGIGDLVTTEEGHSVAVKWIGRQTVHKFLSGMRMQPVRLRAGALGGGLPHSDLTVTAEHGMIIDGLVINASALVNGSTIDFVPLNELPDNVTYFHVETEHHDVIVANGAAAETFVDSAGRKAFDNYAEFVELYGADRIIPEMPRTRISSARLVPEDIRERLQPTSGGAGWITAESA